MFCAREWTEAEDATGGGDYWHTHKRVAENSSGVAGQLPTTERKCVSASSPMHCHLRWWWSVRSSSACSSSFPPSSFPSSSPPLFNFLFPSPPSLQPSQPPVVRLVLLQLHALLPFRLFVQRIRFANNSHNLMRFSSPHFPRFPFFLFPSSSVSLSLCSEGHFFSLFSSHSVLLPLPHWPAVPLQLVLPFLTSSSESLQCFSPPPSQNPFNWLHLSVRRMTTTWAEFVYFLQSKVE